MGAASPSTRDPEQLALELGRALAARDRFIDVASHELKTPLTALKLQIELHERLLTRVGFESFNEEKWRRLLGQSIVQCNRLARLVDDMLDASRINAGRFTMHPRKVSLSSLVREVSGRFGPELRAAGCTLTADIEEGLEARCDPDRYSQVVSNLLANAIRYAPGGRIELELHGDEAGTFLRVRDDGPGIPEERMQVLFEGLDMSRNANDGSGLGLGLYISRAIAHAHGGELRVRSEQGGGADFMFSIPRGLDS
jgi:signal transduction histidine kinase